MKHACIFLSAWAMAVQMIRCFKHALAIMFAPVIPLTISTTIAAASDRPNIILCMADDQGWGDTREALGSTLKL